MAQSLTLSRFISGHQKTFASASNFVVPAWPKCRMSSSLLRRSTGTTMLSSMNRSPHLIESLSNTGLYPSGVVSLSSRFMPALTLVSPRSIAVLIIWLFRSSINSISAFLLFLRLLSCYRITSPRCGWFECSGLPCPPCWVCSCPLSAGCLLGGLRCLPPFPLARVQLPHFRIFGLIYLVFDRLVAAPSRFALCSISACISYLLSAVFVWAWMCEYRPLGVRVVSSS